MHFWSFERQWSTSCTYIIQKIEYYELVNLFNFVGSVKVFLF
jgi:hypothetical protein